MKWKVESAKWKVKSEKDNVKTAAAGTSRSVLSLLQLFLSYFPLSAFRFPLVFVLALSTFHFSLSTAQAAPNTWSTLAAAPATVNNGGALVYPGSGDTIYAFGGGMNGYFLIPYGLEANTQ